MKKVALAPTGNAEHQLGEFQPSGAARDSANAELVLGVPAASRGWYSRGYLPHLDSVGLLQSITFRLADSLPQERLRGLEQQLRGMPAPARDRQRRSTIDAWLDAGSGCCALRHPKLAALVQGSLLKFDDERYRLLAWCVMPNHVHVLIKPSTSLAKIVQSWKSYSGRWA